jgi:hypothetical protein
MTPIRQELDLLVRKVIKGTRVRRHFALPSSYIAEVKRDVARRTTPTDLFAVTELRQVYAAGRHNTRRAE